LWAIGFRLLLVFDTYPDASKMTLATKEAKKRLINNHLALFVFKTENRKHRFRSVFSVEFFCGLTIFTKKHFSFSCSTFFLLRENKSTFWSISQTFFQKSQKHKTVCLDFRFLGLLKQRVNMLVESMLCRTKAASETH
jgi:hypothetical protein